MQMGVLGAMQVSAATPMRPRTRAVLAALAALRHRPVAPDEIAEALWGEHPPTSWPKQVQYCIWDMRRALGADAVLTVDGSYQLAIEDLDVGEFERLLDRGQALAATGAVDHAASTIARGLELWRGRPFEELDGWVPARTEAARLEERRRTAEEDLLDARLAAGDHRAVVALAERFVAEEPLRERRWGQLALAQYRSGNQADALRSLRRARQCLVEQLGIEPGADLAALERAILDQDPAIDQASSALAAEKCPYQGLAPFEADDADLFFGRAADVAAALERLDGVRLLAVAGPSGSGKSSLVRAGLIPSLRRRGRSVAVMVPGVDPDSAFSHAVAGAGGDPILVVDQLEELFGGHHRSAAVESFAARLAAYATERAPVIVTIRSDHLGSLAAEPALARLVEQGLFLVGPLRGDALRATIEGPAAAAGLRLESGLVDLLVRETEGEPAALPLLSHALAETWARRDGRVLTVEGYRATGEIRGAVARSAEQLWASLPTDQQARLRALLLRLVVAVTDGEPVRAHLDRRRLDADADRAQVLDLLVRARLVTADESSVELAHEAVARAWPRLRSWLDEDAAGQRLMHHLAATAEEWDRLDRPASELYRGARLEAAIEWRSANEADLTPLERAFLDESAATADHERQTLVAQAAHQARQNRRLRWSLLGAAALLVAAVAGGVVAASQRSEARRGQREAALSALVGDSLTLRANRRDLAALLAVEAYRLSPDAASEAALFGTFTAAPGAERTISTGGSLATTSGSAAMIDGGRRVAVPDAYGATRLVDIDTGVVEVLPALSEEPGWGLVAASGDGRYLARAWRPAFEPETGMVTVWDLERGGARFDPITIPFRIGQLTLDADGSTLVVSGGIEMRALLFDGDTGERRAEADRLVRPERAGNRVVTAATAFAPDGTLAVGSQAGVVRFVDPATGAELRRIEVEEDASHTLVALTADGRTLVIAGTTMMAYDVESGAPKWPEPVDHQRCNSFALAEAMGAILCGEFTGRVVAFDLESGQPSGRRLDSQYGYVCALAVSPDGRRLAEVTACQSTDVKVVMWAIDGGGPVTRMIPADGDNLGIEHFGFGAEANAIVTSNIDDAGVRSTVLDVDAATVTATFEGVRGLFPTDDSNVAVAVYDDGESPITVGLFDTGSGKPAGPVVDPEMEVDSVWSGAGRAYVVGNGWTRLRVFDLATGAFVGPDIEVPMEDGLDYLNVAGDEWYLGHTVWESGLPVPAIERRDGASGEVLASSPAGYEVVAVGGGVVIAATKDGAIVELDAETLEVTGAPFPATTGLVLSLDVDARGHRLLVRAFDGTTRIFDIATRTQLGDPWIGSLKFSANGALRDDGLAAATISEGGVAVLDLDPEHWMEAACELAGRNLTRDEWDRYVGDLADYRPTCPQYPAAE